MPDIEVWDTEEVYAKKDRHRKWVYLATSPDGMDPVSRFRAIVKNTVGGYAFTREKWDRRYYWRSVSCKLDPGTGNGNGGESNDDEGSIGVEMTP